MDYYARKEARASASLRRLSVIGVVLVVLALSSLLSGCASTPHQTARNFAVAGVAADVVSTHRAIERGCVEGNPLYGKDASIEQIAVINLGLIGLIWWMSEKLEAGNGPTWPLYLLGALRAGVAIRNERINC